MRFEYRRRLLLSRVLFKNSLVLEATEFSAGSSKEDASNMASVISDVRGRGGRIHSHPLARHIPSSLLPPYSIVVLIIEIGDAFYCGVTSGRRDRLILTVASLLLLPSSCFKMASILMALS